MAGIENASLRGFQNYINSLGNFQPGDRVVTEGGSPATRGGDAGAFSRFFNVTTAAKESRAANNAARTELLKAVASEFGGLSNVPENVRKAMNLDKFGVVDNNGDLAATSGKPLTERRVKAIVDAVMTAKTEMDRQIDELATARNMVGDMLRAAPSARRHEMGMVALALKAHGVAMDNLNLSYSILIANPELLRSVQPEGEISVDTLDRYVQEKIDLFEFRSYKGLGDHAVKFNGRLDCAVSIDILERKAEADRAAGRPVEKYIFESRDEMTDYNEEYMEPFDAISGDTTSKIKQLFDTGFDLNALIDGRYEIRSDAYFYAPSHIERMPELDCRNQIAGDADRTAIEVDFNIDGEEFKGSFDARKYDDEETCKTAAKAFAFNMEQSVRKLLGLGDNDKLTLQAKATMYVMTQVSLNPVRNYFGPNAEHDACKVSFRKNEDGGVIAQVSSSKDSVNRFDFKIEIDPDGQNRMYDVSLG